VQVHFYATLRAAVGTKTVEFDVPAGASVRILIDAVIARYPQMRDELLDADGELFRHVHVFVNGRDTYYLDDNMEHILSPDDTIDVFPPVAGG